MSVDLTFNEGSRRRSFRRLQNQSPDPAAGLFVAPDFDREQARLFRLELDLLEDDSALALARIDRAWIGFSRGPFSAKLGRQALSFGGGLTFQILDFINPFAPSEFNKDYKTGDDIAFLQYSPSSEQTLEFAFIPRRDTISYDVEEESFGYLANYQRTFFETGTDFSLLVARDLNDWHQAVSISQSIGGAVFRSDLLFTQVGGNQIFSFLANLDRSFSVWGRTLYGFLEYYQNGFADQSKAVQARLLEKLTRGQLFVQGEKFLSTGLTLEMTPLLNVSLLAIFQLEKEDGALIQPTVNYDLSQDTELLFGARIPYGSEGSDFGGPEGFPLSTDFFAQVSLFW